MAGKHRKVDDEGQTFQSAWTKNIFLLSIIQNLLFNMPNQHRSYERI